MFRIPSPSVPVPEGVLVPELREAHMKGPERCAYPLLALLCTSERGGAYADSSPSEIPVSTPNAGERLREARRYTAGKKRALGPWQCDTRGTKITAAARLARAGYVAG